MSMTMTPQERNDMLAAADDLAEVIKAADLDDFAGLMKPLSTLMPAVIFVYLCGRLMACPIHTCDSALCYEAERKTCIAGRGEPPYKV